MNLKRLEEIEFWVQSSFNDGHTKESTRLLYLKNLVEELVQIVKDQQETINTLDKEVKSMRDLIFQPITEPEELVFKCVGKENSNDP